MLDYTTHFEASLRTFGQTIQTPAGEMQAVVRVKRNQEYLKVKGRGIEIDRDQSYIAVTEANAALLSKGQSITAQGQSYDIVKPVPYNGFVRFLLVESQISNPTQGVWQ